MMKVLCKDRHYRRFGTIYTKMGQYKVTSYYCQSCHKEFPIKEFNLMKKDYKNHTCKARLKELNKVER